MDPRAPQPERATSLLSLAFRQRPLPPDWLRYIYEVRQPPAGTGARERKDSQGIYEPEALVGCRSSTPSLGPHGQARADPTQDSQYPEGDVYWRYSDRRK